MSQVITNGPLSENVSAFLGKAGYAAASVVRTALFSFIWWALTNGDASSWWLGVPAIVLAVMASLTLIPPVPLLWSAWFRFVPLFFIRSLIGGIDVAWRAFHPRLPIAPDLIEYPLILPPGLAQVVLVNTVSLLPGTLSVELSQSVLKVHVLDGGYDFKMEIVAIEQQVMRMFGLDGCGGK